MNKSYQKYSGAGNKFIIFDNLSDDIADRSEMVVSLFKNGANDEVDGVIFLEKGDPGDFSMNYFNRDGTADSLCGNGLRCTTRFISDNALSPKKLLHIASIGNIYLSGILDDGRITVSFPPPMIIRAEMKLKVNFSGWWEDLPCSYVDVGSPHIVIFIDDIGKGLKSMDEVNVEEWGRNIRMHNDLLPAGANVNFVQVTDPADSSLIIHTYERGVERETLACGTGALSSGIVAFIKKGLQPPINMFTRSGEILSVGFKVDGNEFRELTLTGGAERYE
ncbi:MAG TPA: diaminopimelate epimerase [Ignavibacteria bacterium]|nr:diaminopimelate epimerase [Ignavibacteria bacterium]